MPHDAPTVRLQPRPVDCDLSHTWVGGVCVTTIMRDWRPGDSGRCRLCPASACTARGRDHCVVVVRLHVPPASASLFALPEGGGQDGARLGVHAHHQGRYARV